MQYPQQLKVGNNSYKIEYHQVFKNSSSVSFRKGKIKVKISRFVRGSQRDEIVQKFLIWASKKLSKASQGNLFLPLYKDGERIVTHNKIYELNIFQTQSSKSKTLIKNINIIEIYLEKNLSKTDIDEKIKYLVEKIIIKDQEKYLQEVVKELNQLHFQENYKSVRFKRIYGRFGSCSSKRNINIAYRLLFAPKDVFRYVCLHELAHLKEFNHSKKFWQLIENAMPQYKHCEKWLKESGFALG